VGQRSAGPVKAGRGLRDVHAKEMSMNWDTVKGNWKQFSGKIKEKWGKLTDDDLTTIAGKRDQLLGKLQERYGYGKDEAERELNDFSRTLSNP
jgi:uncharacterized protein YjbJ (UPF0337 family)